MEENKYSNFLVNEKSPYLIQHAYNPVKWHPWSDEAFEKARDLDKPVFLSIGYSTCHWCHVMANESFESPEVAQALNDVFIPIKVDREERPDLDSIYMNACQLMTGAGGWPLTVFLTPDKKPFFAGTYIPKLSIGQRIGILELIERVKHLWDTDRDKINSSAQEVVRILEESATAETGEGLGEQTLVNAYTELTNRYDRENGGFGDQPKFPTPHNLLFLLRYWKRTGEAEALSMVEHTLRSIRRGGIFDQIGLGVHRYSTDAQWLVPHFEKMLYDQALLGLAYLETFQATANKKYGQTAWEILSYVLRDMSDPGGGFHSAEDADTEGEEGKFYLWTEGEIREVLGTREASFFSYVYNLHERREYSAEYDRTTIASNIPNRTENFDEIAKDLSVPRTLVESRLRQSSEKLFAARELRAHPHRDDKILTDWNGLMIAALSKGGRILEMKPLIDAAQKAARFIHKNLAIPGGGMLHRYRDGQSGIEGGLDDYAFFTWGLLELYEATFDAEYLHWALDLTEYAIRHFEDTNRGGFFMTPDYQEQTLIRPKEIYDGALPSGNSVMALNLLRLSKITGRSEFEQKAFAIECAFSETVERMPSAFTQLLSAVDFRLGPSYEVVIAGEPDWKDTQAMLAALQEQFLPNKVVLLKSDERQKQLEKLAGFTKKQTALSGKATAYVCYGYNCKVPTNDVSQMMEMLRSESAQG